ncbi:unknown [Clostridium sp. CAG:448]|nr:unknown [Clostridium sp. CAG:448]
MTDYAFGDNVGVVCVVITKVGGGIHAIGVCLCPIQKKSGAGQVSLPIAHLPAGIGIVVKLFFGKERAVHAFKQCGKIECGVQCLAVGREQKCGKPLVFVRPAIVCRIRPYFTVCRVMHEKTLFQPRINAVGKAPEVVCVCTISQKIKQLCILPQCIQ